MTTSTPTSGSIDWQALAGSLASDMAVQPFARQGAMLFWSTDGERLLHADEAAQPLVQGLGVGQRSPAWERLRLLATGLAPRNGVRLERLKLLSDTAGALVTCACRRVSDGHGGEVLLTALSAQELRRVMQQQADADTIAALPGGVALPHTGLATENGTSRPHRQDATRFTWESDAARMITRMSPEFASITGTASEKVTGASWDALLENDIEDDAGHLAAALAQTRTWSGLDVTWRLAGQNQGRRIRLSAMPYSVDGLFAGFRGFGLARDPATVPFRPVQAVAGQIADADAADGLNAAAPAPQVQDIVHPAGESGSPPSQPDAASRSAGVQHLTPVPDLAEPALRDNLRDNLVALRLPRAAPFELRAVPSSQPQPAPAETSRSALTPSERNAFREIAQALGARLDAEMRQPPAGVPLPEPRSEPRSEPERATSNDHAPSASPASKDMPATSAGLPSDASVAGVSPEVARAAHALVLHRTHNAHAEMLDKLPIAVMVQRAGQALYANRTLLDLLDYADIDDLNAAGGVDRCMSGTPGASPAEVVLLDRQGDRISVDTRSSEIIWKDVPATLLSFRRASGDADERAKISALMLDVASRDARLGEMTAVLDTATDGVVTVDERGRILSLNKSAEALFGFDQREVTGDLFTLLLAPESHTRALDYLEGLKGGGVASVLNDGREVIGRVRQGGRITLFMTMGQIAQGAVSAELGRKFCAVLRDITSWKKTELDLVEARKQAENASAQKSDVLAKISHEIRTPLNAIIGFSEVMSEERFGPIGNERYKEYLRDIHESGGYVISLVNDLLDLAKIEAGKLDLDFVSVNLNEIAASSVTLLQPEAQRGRVVLRSGLAQKLPPVVADERSIRQIMINVLSNAVKFTDAGGQVIVSSALGDKGEVILRVRDTGIGMTEADLKLALEPFRQVQSTRKAGGTGLGLPLTKALVEANRASLAITSARNEGTLIEITFPPQRVLAG